MRSTSPTPRMQIGSGRGRRCVAAVLTAGLVGGLAFAAAPADAVSAPDRIQRVWLTPSNGSFTVHWSAAGGHTTSYRLRTGLTPFSSTDASLPRTGRNSQTFTTNRHARSFTFSAAQLAAAGAPLGSGNQLFLQVSAIDQTGTGRRSWTYPYQLAGLPAVPQHVGQQIRVATFNVRTARGTGRPWLTRAPQIAREIVKYHPAVVALQELGLGRADGQPGSAAGTENEIQSFLRILGSVGASRYKLISTRSYVRPGTRIGTQGARILYDSSQVDVLVGCRETGEYPVRTWSSCGAISLGGRTEDNDILTRFANYAEFSDRHTGKPFWFVSFHLDQRHEGTHANQISLNRLRGFQMYKVIDDMNGHDLDNTPIVIAGDLNSWQTDPIGDAPHDLAIHYGYHDSFAATHLTNARYNTFNGFHTTLHPAKDHYSRRIDQILYRGFTGSATWTNVMKPTDNQRPSDHNMVISDLIY